MKKQILRAAYPTAWGPKLAALRMTRAGIGCAFPGLNHYSNEDLSPGTPARSDLLRLRSGQALGHQAFPPLLRKDAHPIRGRCLGWAARPERISSAKARICFFTTIAWPPSADTTARSDLPRLDSLFRSARSFWPASIL